MLSLHRFVFNPFEENTYVLVETATQEAAVVDPGMSDARERAAFDKFVADNKLSLRQAIITHAHVDHCFGLGYVTERYGASTLMSALDRPLLHDLGEQARRFGLQGLFAGGSQLKIDTEVGDGDIIAIGESTLRVIASPGHSPGGIALYCPEQKFVITGDSLFKNSIGRTDFPGGDLPTLVSSVRDRLLSLPADTVVLSGHGPETSVGAEQRNNPFVR